MKVFAEELYNAEIDWSLKYLANKVKAHTRVDYEDVKELMSLKLLKDDPYAVFHVFRISYLKYAIRGEIGDQYRIELINKAKLFEVDDQIADMMMATSSPKYIKGCKLPFKRVFVTTNLEIAKGIKLNGFMLGYCNHEGKHVYEEQDSDGISITFEILNLKTGTSDIVVAYTDTAGKIKLYDTDVKYKSKKHFGKAINFAKNILLFFNEPRVKTYLIASNNERRERKGKLPIPSMIKTRINTELSEYLRLGGATGVRRELNYSFDVRGHWRELKNDRYKEQKRIWIAPFIKGKGLKVPQIFEVK